MSTMKEALFQLRYIRADMFALVPSHKCIIMYTLYSCIIILYVAAFPGMANPINWQISIRMGSTGEYKRPINKNPDDYVNYEELKTIAKEIIENKKRIMYVNDELTVNGYWDTGMKIFATLATLC